MLANQIFESIDGFCFGNVEFHRGLADVKIHFAGRAADVAEICIRHFAGTVHDASHDGDLHALEVQRGGFDFRRRGLQIEQRPSAGWAGDVISLENPRARCLQDVVGQRSACPGASSPWTKIASPIPSQSSEPMLVDAVRSVSRNVGALPPACLFVVNRLSYQNIFQQNRMARV